MIHAVFAFLLLLTAATLIQAETQPEGRIAFDCPIPSPTGLRTSEGDPIHEILIQGNSKIHTSEILKTLKAADENIEKAAETLLKKMSTKLEEVEITLRKENGKNLAVLTLKERTTPRHNSSFQAIPMVQFNRVSGWKPGAAVKLDLESARFSKRMPTSTIFASTAYGIAIKRIDYEIGVDTMPFAIYTHLKNLEDDTDKWFHGFGINAKVHDTTDIIPNNREPHFNNLFTLLYNISGAQDLHNYYFRSGHEIVFRWQNPPLLPAYTAPRHLLRLTLLAEKHESLKKNTDWHFFNWRSASKTRENPAITSGRMRSVMFTYDLNLRTNHLGWHNTFFIEHTNTAFGSDFDFTQYQLHLRYAHPLGKHQIRTRTIGSFSNASLPIQRQFTIGGPGILNGYPLYAFSGDRGFLFNTEFFYNLPQNFISKYLQPHLNPDIFLVFFIDAGQTWDVATHETFALLPKSNAGIGLQFGFVENNFNFILRFNLAKAFEAQQEALFNITAGYSF